MKEKPSAEILASDLPREASRESSPKAQLLLVAEILKSFTDEEHGLTADEIREAIGIRTGKTPTAAKVRDDIHALAACRLFGMDIDIPPRGKADGFRCKKTFLSSEDARLAINMVKTSKFITREQCRRICDDLYGMVSYYQQDSIAGSVMVDERDLPSNSDVFAAAEAFSAAIETGRKVRFQYYARGLDGDEHCIENSLDGGSYFEETPVALIFSFGNYYAETWSERAHRGQSTVRRLDRVRNASVAETPAESGELVDLMRATVQERIGQTFDMFGEGETRDLFLRVGYKAARYVYDRFGHNISFRQIAKDGSYGFIHVRVKPAATFYRWLFGMGSQITLEEPHGALWESVFWPDDSPGIPHDELIRDYNEAISGMRRQMASVCNAYGWKLE